MKPSIRAYRENMKEVTHYLSQIRNETHQIFRGHSDRTWELKSSIGRNLNGDWKLFLNGEKDSISEFRKKAVPHINPEQKTDIECLSIMQQHGCSTRLLDFTTNPLVALFFACESNPKIDGELIISNYSRTFESENIGDIFSSQCIFVYHPPHMDSRIIGQSGCFICCRTPNKVLSGKQIKKITVPADKKLQIINELKTLGISYSSINQDLDGVCRDINTNLLSELEWTSS